MQKLCISMLMKLTPDHHVDVPRRITHTSLQGSGFAFVGYVYSMLGIGAYMSTMPVCLWSHYFFPIVRLSFSGICKTAVRKQVTILSQSYAIVI